MDSSSQVETTQEIESTYANNPIKSLEAQGFFKMGYGPEKYECQDSFCIIDFLKDRLFAAVYDGYGPSGRECSQASNDYIQTAIEMEYSTFMKLNTDQEIKDFLKTAFQKAEARLELSGIDYSVSGTCCTSAYIHKNKCYVANLGNSRVVLGRKDGDKIQALDLSKDHTPERPDEKERVIKAGAQVKPATVDGVVTGPDRVWLYEKELVGVTTTRALSSSSCKELGIISEPEISCIGLNTNDKFLILGSDGLWSVMTSKEAVDFVSQLESTEKAAEDLVSEARKRWDQNNESGKSIAVGDSLNATHACDDINAIVVYIIF